MIVWTLFVLHKVLMVAIGLGAVLFVLNRPNRALSLLLAGFLITQAAFGLCIITLMENAARSHYGFTTSPENFILHGFLPGQAAETIARIIFMAAGLIILSTILQSHGKETT